MSPYNTWYFFSTLTKRFFVPKPKSLNIIPGLQKHMVPTFILATSGMSMGLT